MLLGSQGTSFSHQSKAPGCLPAGAEERKGRMGRCSYQAKVQSVVVIFRHGQVHCQGHAVGKDGQQDDGLEGSDARVKEGP